MAAPTPPSTDADRLEREAAFHDHVFSDDTRSAVKPFYEVAKSSRAFYESVLAARAGDGVRALEYGCGPGSHAFFLADRGCDVLGIDISPGAIQIAADEAARTGYADRVGFRVMNAEALELEDDSRDLVCGTGIIHHLDLRKAYAEIARVLAPGGTAVFEEPLGHNPLINAFRRRTPQMRTVDEHPLREDDLELAREFFGRVDVRYFHLFALATVPFRRLPGFSALLTAADAADRALFAGVPPLRKHAWQAVLVLEEPRSL